MPLIGAGPAFSQAGQPRRVAYLGGVARFQAVFRDALRDLGYVEGRDIVISTHWTDDPERVAALAAKLVAGDPEVIVTAGSAQVAACKKATSTIPIVFASAGDPVEQGFVATLQRPGGNITGVLAHSALHAKIVEITREALPSARRLGILVHETDPYLKYVLRQFEPSARRYGFEAVVVGVKGGEDLQRAFEDFSKRKVDAAIVPTLSLFSVKQKQIGELGLKAKLPLLSPHSNFASAGGLLSYGPPREESYRRAALLTDKILRGAKPAELPVEQPERFQLVINRRTAGAIGAKLSKVTMFRADRVID